MRCVELHNGHALKHHVTMTHTGMTETNVHPLKVLSALKISYSSLIVPVVQFFFVSLL